MNNQNEPTKFMVFTFDDGTIWKVDLTVIRKSLVHSIVQLGDIDITEAYKQVTTTHESTFIMHACLMTWKDVRDDIVQIWGVPSESNYTPEMGRCKKEIMTETEIDRFLTQPVL